MGPSPSRGRADLPDDAKLSESVRRISAAYQPRRIYLFGSRARDDARSHSDYDLLVVVEKLTAPAYRMAQEAHTLLWGLGISVDVLFWSKDEFERRLHLRASLPATVVREGKLLHAA